ncbi:MAG TPA: hypothetical protein VK086_05025 [Ruania sp.]|nr:hypothetical protein [Ruania sp.]
MDEVLTWIMDADPAIRWQAQRDLLGASPQRVAAERARVAQVGWGRRLLDLQVEGQWADGAYFPGPNWLPTEGVTGDPQGQPWTATMPTLRLLRDFGVDPGQAAVQDAVHRAGRAARWEHGGEALFDGETEPCINGATVAIGAYFGQAMDGLVQRLLGEQLDDGGWNCEAENGSVRSSFHTTIGVLEGLLEYERSGGAVPVAEARGRAEEYLLLRGLCRRASTGEVIDADWLTFSFPVHWYYDILRGLDYFYFRGGIPDPRLDEAVQCVRDCRQPDGTWLLQNTHPGLVHFQLEEGDGRPSRWNTLRALRVLNWYDSART